MTSDTTRHTIVSGFDDSPESHAALHWAAAEAKARDAVLRIVTVWDSSPAMPWTLPELSAWRDQAHRRAERVASAGRDAVGTGLAVDVVALEGSPGPVLVAESSGADLLVVGSAGHVGLAGLVAGSVSRHCLRRTACPLVVLGPRAHSDSTRRLVVSSTLDPRGDTQDWIATWVERHPVPILVVASFDITASVAELALTSARAEVRAALRRQNEDWVRSLRAVVDERAGAHSEITGIVDEGGAQSVLELHTRPGDLLVVPARCEHAVPVAHSSCPIAVVPPLRAQRVRERSAVPERSAGVLSASTGSAAIG